MTLSALCCCAGRDAVEGYRTVAGVAETEFVEKRSRFISAAACVSTEEEAMAFVRARRELYRDAGHTVYAYLLRNGRQRYSDDGEPQGTGGIPALDVLKRSGLVDIAVAVTRYFGGILLGAGGLTRAYSRGAADAVAAAAIIEYALCAVVEVLCDYNQYGRIENACRTLGVRILESEFAADVTLRVLTRAGDADAFIAAVTELTAATALAEKQTEIFAIF
jgi:uncharacterized YigZ family protein